MTAHLFDAVEHILWRLSLSQTVSSAPLPSISSSLQHWALCRISWRPQGNLVGVQGVGDDGKGRGFASPKEQSDTICAVEHIGNPILLGKMF